MIRPDVCQVSFEIVDESRRGVMRTVVPDTEYGGVGLVGVGLYECVWSKGAVGGVDYKVER